MKKVKDPCALQVLGATVGLLLICAAELALWWLCGYMPLLLLAVLQLLGAVVELVLLIPIGRHCELTAADPEEKRPFFKKLLTGVANFFRKIVNFFHKHHNAVLAVLLLAAIVAANILFWPRVSAKSDAAQLQFYVPVVVAVLFAASVVLEKWCGFIPGSDGCSKRMTAIAKNLKGMLMLGRIAQVLVMLVMVLSLVGLYDAQLILSILLAVLFVYLTVMLLLSVAIRIIRKELSTEPALPLSPKAMGTAGVISYLEENTGITMRSLWSIQLIRQLLPSLVMIIVLLTWVTTGLVQIEAHQEGAVYRFGKLQPETLQPGLHLTLPWPIDKTEVYDTQSLRRVVVGYVPNGSEDNTWTDGHSVNEFRLLLGGGNEMVSINLQVEYRISDLNKYLKNAAAAESLISASAYEIVTARTIVTDIDSLLASDRVEFSHTFKEELIRRIEHYDAGVEVTDVVLESIHPPVEVASVYQQVITAGIQAEQLLLEAQRAAVLEVASAKQQAYAEKSIAQTSYYQAIANAESAIASFMAGVEANKEYPEAFRYHKYITAMTEAYTKGVVIIVGEGVDSGSLIIGDLSRPIAEDPYYLEDEVEEEYYE